MFYYDRGLFLTRPRLAVDVRRRQKLGFVSHAHMDHMARHETALCTPATGQLYRLRLGAERAVRELAYREPTEIGEARLTTFPAGHCLGSAMLKVEVEGKSLLYSGDFKLEKSATAEQAELPCADTFVVESTFGDPRYRRRPRAAAVTQLCELVGEALESGATPVVHAYVLGKGQEVTRILSDAGFAVLQHELVHEVSEVYSRCGADLGNYSKWPGYAKHDHVVVAPPKRQRAKPLEKLGRAVHIAVTGWAADAGAKYRLGVDHAVPLSDHADYTQLMDAVDRVGASEVYATHGPKEFVDRLREAGHNAYRLNDVRARP